ncbi:hydrolase [Patescibacteria group bacterium]
MTNKAGQCCPEFQPERWNEKTHVWKDKLFIRDRVRQLFHIPLNMGKVVKRMFDKIQKVNAAPNDEDFLMLAYDPTPWISEIHMTVTKEVPDAEMVKLSGTFISKVFDGPYSAVPKWAKEMESFIEKKNQKIKKMYFHFAYCPKCVKKYGKNYSIAFGEVE